MNCYICGYPVKGKWQGGGIRLICNNKKCKAPQNDCEAYTARKYKRRKNL